MVAMPQYAPSTPWEMAADDVLAVVMRDTAGYKYARFERGLLPGLMPEKHRAALQAVYSLYEAGQPIHDSLIIARAGGKVDMVWINQIIALYGPVRGSREIFKANLDLVMDEGLRHGSQRLLEIAAQQLQRGKPREEVTRNIIGLLQSLNVNKGISGVTAAEFGPRYAARLLDDPAPTRSTGIPWLDKLTGGYMPANLWWVAGAYKSRKTTVILNMALGAAVMGEKPAILSREMTQEQVYWQLVSMLAVALLKRRGLTNTMVSTASGNKIPMLALSPVGLMQAGNQYRRWPSEKVKAIDDAIAMMETLPIRIYDSRPELGNLSTITTLENTILTDLEKFGGTLFFGDYIQLFTTPDMQNMAQSEELKANAVQNICKTHNAMIIFVAQQNEAGVKGEGGYSPNIAGGGAVPKTANALITTKYKATDNDADSCLNLTMKLARNAASRTNEDFDIHPATGLIDGQTWFERLS